MPSRQGPQMLRSDDVERVTTPSVLFVGTSTAGSRVHAEFAGFARRSGRPGLSVIGIDLPRTAPDRSFGVLADAMAANPWVYGAVITDHKLRMYGAVRERLARREFGVDLMGEVNTLRTAGTGTVGFARDLFAIAHVLRSAGLRRERVICLGAGGAARSLLFALVLDEARSSRDGVPRLRAVLPRVVMTDTDPAAVRAVTELGAVLGLPDGVLDVRRVDGADGNGQVVSDYGSDALVVNATGLGKFGPGSPLPAGALLPPTAVAWDFNYRGPLTFVSSARAGGNRAVDGATYYEAGWLTALGAILGRSVEESLGETIHR